GERLLQFQISQRSAGRIGHAALVGSTNGPKTVNEPRIPQLRSTESARRNPSGSKVDGFLPLSRHRPAVLGGDAKPHSNDVRERKMPLQLHSRTPSLLQDSPSLSANSVKLRNPG